MHVVGVLTTHAPEELGAAHELVAGVEEWLRSRRIDGRG
jgi:hypothetical protein